MLDPKPADGSRLTRATRDEMLRPQVKVEEGSAFALGWSLIQHPKGEIITHSGDNPGYKAMVFASVSRQSGVVVMTNGDNGMAATVCRDSGYRGCNRLPAMTSRDWLRPLTAVLVTVVSGCGGSTTMETPTSPTAPPAATAPPPASTTPPPSNAPSFPDMLGPWTGKVALLYADRATPARHGFTCDHTWTIDSQSEGTFSGRIQGNGQGASSDPWCDHHGGVTGTMTADGALTLRFELRLRSNGCTAIAADGVVTGNVIPGRTPVNTDGPTMKGTASDSWTCTNIVGQPFAADRTVTLEMWKR